MKERRTIRFGTLTALIGASVLIVACGRQSKVAASSDADNPTAIAVAAATWDSTVQSIDYQTRMITLKAPAGTIKQYQAGRDVVNFGQIQVGDTVNATVIDEVAVFVRNAGAPPSASEGTTVALAPKGAKPGIIIADTDQLTSKIEAVNKKDRTITLEEIAGKPKTLRVASGVNLADLKKGDDVVVQYTRAFALLVEKP